MGENASEFEQAARQSRRGHLLAELWYLTRRSGKWWLIPFLLPVLLFGALMFLAGTGAAPFIYTLF